MTISTMAGRNLSYFIIWDWNRVYNSYKLNNVTNLSVKGVDNQGRLLINLAFHTAAESIKIVEAGRKSG